MNKENNRTVLLPEGTSLMDFVKAQSKPEDYVLTNEEYEAVYDYIDGRKDSFPEPLKEGLLKLLNGEMHRRI